MKHGICQPTFVFMFTTPLDMDMAGSNSREAIDVSTVIDKNFKCCICQDIYNDPRGLPCQHAFCYQCLQNHINSTVEEGRKNFECPLCKGEVRAPNSKKRKQTWAKQFKPDFKLTSILDDLHQCAAAAAAPSTTTASTTKIPPTGIQQTPNPRQQLRHVPFATSPNITGTLQRDDAGRVQSGDITSGSIIHTTDTDVLKEVGSDNSNQAISGSVERCIVLASGDQVSYDLTVVVQGEKRIILTPHFEGKSLLAITLNPRMEEVRRCSFDLEATPIRICHLDNSVVAITTLNPNAIALYKMEDELLFQKRILTKQAYDGIACLENGLFVVTTQTDVHIVDCNGGVLAEYKVTMPNVIRPDNCYVSVTRGGEIVTTDLSGHALTCLKRDGKVIWQKKKKSFKNPMGTAVDSSGAIFLADHASEAIVQLNTKGSLVCNVVEKSEQLRKPSAIALDNMGYMYVICDFNFIAVVRLSNCDS